MLNFFSFPVVNDQAPAAGFPQLKLESAITTIFFCLLCPLLCPLAVPLTQKSWCRTWKRLTLLLSPIIQKLDKRVGEFCRVVAGDRARFSERDKLTPESLQFHQRHDSR